MKRGFRKFEPPIEEKLSSSVVLYVRAAGSDGQGATRATVEAWNGRVLHTDQLNLTNAGQRGRFAQDLAAKVARIKPQRISRCLLELESKLAAELSKSEAPPPPPTVDVEALWLRARDLAEDTRLLELVEEATVGMGLVGEGDLVKLAYLAATARLLQKPVNVIVKGPPSGGKSVALECVVRLLPPSAYVNYSAVTPRYLAYCQEDLRHRIVVLYEAQGMDAEGTGAYIMRSLLSEGRLDIGTVDKNEAGGIEAKHLTKEGPTALFTSTVRVALESQLETRTFSLAINDTSEQSRNVVLRQGDAAAGQAPAPPDLEPFYALQEWLATAGERRVIIPYAPALARLVPCDTIRIRRDFPRLLSMLSACAILHQAQRLRAAGGEIQATYTDYALVRDLLAEVFTATQQGGLTAAQRRTVEAVTALCAASAIGMGGVSVESVAKHLKIERSVAQRHLSGARRGGYLLNIETRRNHAAVYVVGESLPKETCELPTVEVLKAEVERNR